MELHAPYRACIRLHEKLMAAGIELGLEMPGTTPINFICTEKEAIAPGCGTFYRTIRRLRRGFGFCDRWSKPFIRRESIGGSIRTAVKRQLVIFVLDDPGPMLWGSAPIYRHGETSRLHDFPFLRPYCRRTGRDGYVK